MFYFPNLDEQTRLIMIQELEFDLKIGLFYEPVSMTISGLIAYKRLLKECFENGTPETLLQKLSPTFFKLKDRNGRKIPTNIREMITFSDFNRYYVRALLLHALKENRKLCVYRAKQVMNERKESKLFGLHSQTDILKPNSGLSLRFIEKSLK